MVKFLSRRAVSNEVEIMALEVAVDRSIHNITQQQIVLQDNQNSHGPEVIGQQRLNVEDFNNHGPTESRRTK